jgi:hypothetical protein
LSNIQFNEAFMNMTKGAARAPGSSRKGRVRRKDAVPVVFSKDVTKVVRSKVRPGLDPKVLKYVRVDGRHFEIRLRDGNKLVATVLKGSGRYGYSFRLVGERKAHGGFASMKELVARVATKL